MQSCQAAETGSQLWLVLPFLLFCSASDFPAAQGSAFAVSEVAASAPQSDVAGKHAGAQNGCHKQELSLDQLSVTVGGEWLFDLYIQPGRGHLEMHVLW